MCDGPTTIFSEVIPLVFLVEPHFCMVRLPCFHGSQIALGRGFQGLGVLRLNASQLLRLLPNVEAVPLGMVWMEGNHPYMGYQSREILLYTDDKYIYTYL
jgi:hypothetical protein